MCSMKVEISSSAPIIVDEWSNFTYEIIIFVIDNLYQKTCFKNVFMVESFNFGVSSGTQSD